MKITQLRDKDKTTALTTMDMETWIGKTRTETKTRPVSAFREVLRYSLPDSRCYEADKLPKILPAAEFRRAEGGKQMKSYNGIVELTVGPLSGGPEITLVKQLAWEQPQTHCVFTGSSPHKWLFRELFDRKFEYQVSDTLLMRCSQLY